MEKGVYLGIAEDFEKSPEMDYLMRVDPSGLTFLLFFALCLFSADTMGKLYDTVGELTVPYDAKRIRTLFPYQTVSQIEKSLNIYMDAGLMYKDADGILTISNDNRMFAFADAGKQRELEELERGSTHGTET